jgi:hypothetical protein
MKTTSRDAGWVGALASLTGAYAIGQAIQVSNGNGDPVAFKWLAFGLASFVMAVAAGDLGRPGRWAGGLIVALGGAMALHQVWQLGSVPPAIYLRNTSYFEFMQRLGVFAALGLSLLSVKPWLGKAALPVWIGSFFVLGAWLIAKSPAPGIDVFTWTNYAIENFAKGHNPWMIDYPNPYGHTLWYAPGLADNQWYHSGYGYPPASFLLSALGYLVGGDMRWANLTCLAIAASCFFFIRGRFGAIAAVLLLATPRILFILEQAWTDVYIIGFLGLVMWSAIKWPKATPYFLGVMFAIKQYMVFVAPLALLLLPPEWTLKQKVIFFAKALGTAALITLPFGVTNPVKFINSITVSGLPFRVEALSFLSKTAVNGVPVWPVWIQLPLMVPAYLLIWWRAPRGPVGFAMGMALVMSVFFSFSKHAFCNHHFLSLGCACAALAAILSQPVPTEKPAT